MSSPQHRHLLPRQSLSSSDPQQQQQPGAEHKSQTHSTRDLRRPSLPQQQQQQQQQQTTTAPSLFAPYPARSAHAQPQTQQILPRSRAASAVSTSTSPHSVPSRAVAATARDHSPPPRPASPTPDAPRNQAADAPQPPPPDTEGGGGGANGYNSFQVYSFAPVRFGAEGARRASAEAPATTPPAADQSQNQNQGRPFVNTTIHPVSNAMTKSKRVAARASPPPLNPVEGAGSGTATAILAAAGTSTTTNTSSSSSSSSNTSSNTSSSSVNSFAHASGHPGRRADSNTSSSLSAPPPPPPPGGSTLNDTHPGKRIACIECRQQKVRCDAHQKYPGACTRCSKKSLKCVLQPDFKRTYKRRRLVEVEKENLLLRQSMEQAQQQHAVPQDQEKLRRMASAGSLLELSNSGHYAAAAASGARHDPLASSPSPQPSSPPSPSSPPPPPPPPGPPAPLAVPPQTAPPRGLDPLYSTLSSRWPESSAYQDLPPPIYQRKTHHHHRLTPSPVNTPTPLAGAAGAAGSSPHHSPAGSTPRTRGSAAGSVAGGGGGSSSTSWRRAISSMATDTWHDYENGVWKCTEKSMEGVTLTPTVISKLFNEFITKYHPVLPVVDISRGPEKIYQLSPSLFWTVMTVAARRFDKDGELMLQLTPLLKTCLSEITISPVTRFAPGSSGPQPFLNVASVYTVQAFLIFTMWPSITSSLSADSAWNTAGLAMFSAIRVGLHCPGYARDFGRIKADNPIYPQISEQIRTWICCNIVSQTVATVYGFPAFTSFDAAVISACQSDSGVDVPESIKQLMMIENVEAETATTLNSNPKDPLGLSELSERLSLIQILSRRLDELETRLAGADDLRRFVFLGARVHLLTYYFLDNGGYPELQLQKGIVQAYNSALALMEHADTVSRRDRYFFKYLPGIYVQILWQSTAIVCKVHHSPFARFVDAAAGRALYLACVALISKASIFKHDMMYRASEIMQQMWRLYGSLARRRAGAGGPLTGGSIPRIRIRTRMAASVFFDTLWTMREECGIMSVAPAILNQRNSEEEEEDKEDDDDDEAGYDEEDELEDEEEDEADDDEGGGGDALSMEAPAGGRRAGRRRDSHAGRRGSTPGARRNKRKRAEPDVAARDTPAADTPPGRWPPASRPEPAAAPPSALPLPLPPQVAPPAPQQLPVPVPAPPAPQQQLPPSPASMFVPINHTLAPLAQQQQPALAAAAAAGPGVAFAPPRTHVVPQQQQQQQQAVYAPPPGPPAPPAPAAAPSAGAPYLDEYVMSWDVDNLMRDVKLLMDDYGFHEDEVFHLDASAAAAGGGPGAASAAAAAPGAPPQGQLYPGSNGNGGTGDGHVSFQPFF